MRALQLVSMRVALLVTSARRMTCASDVSERSLASSEHNSRLDVVRVQHEVEHVASERLKALVDRGDDGERSGALRSMTVVQRAPSYQRCDMTARGDVHTQVESFAAMPLNVYGARATRGERWQGDKTAIAMNVPADAPRARRSGCQR